MRDNPERFGELVTTMEGRAFLGRAQQTFEPARAAAREAAGHGAEFERARAELSTMIGAAIARRGDALSIDNQSIRKHANVELDTARQRLASARSAQKTMPTSDQIDYRLRRALRRLSPQEVEQLRWTLSPQRLTLAHKLRQTARDVALGRDGV